MIWKLEWVVDHTNQSFKLIQRLSQDGNRQAQPEERNKWHEVSGEIS